MSDQYIFKLQFKGVGHQETQYVIMDKTSISDFSKFKEDLSKCTPEPFLVQYLDDDDDIVSVDTAEEFKEFTKLVTERSSKGMLLKLIINSKLSCQPATTTYNCRQVNGQTGIVETLENEVDQGAQVQTQNDMIEEDMNEWMLKMKLEIKDEILSEMKNHLESTRPVYAAEGFFCEVDSDGNAFPVENNSRQRKIQNKYYKKLDKKEKHDLKIDQRLENLELKKKKLLEKASLRTAISRRPFIDSTTVGVPFIMSGIATKESSSLPKRVTVGRVFLQVWHVINDGTVAWNNVELRHTWSSPGLEPDEVSIKCTPLAPGQEDHITMKFKAPKIVGSFTSYWHFFYQVDSTWQQFGHYVSVTGSCKMPKLPVGCASITQDSNRKRQKHETKTGYSPLPTEEELAPIKSDFNKKSQQGYVQFPTEQDLTKLKAGEGVKVLNSSGPPPAQSSAQLRSAEIAAEMARVAATLQRLVLKPPSAPGTTTTPTKCLAEELKIPNPCQMENLVDSASDSDINVDSNEDTDPGFVFVDIPTQSSSAVELVNNSAEAATENLTKPEERIDEMKQTEIEKNEKELLEVINNEIGKLVNVEKNELLTFHTSELQKSQGPLKPIPSESNENDKNGNTVVENISSDRSVNSTIFPQAGPLPMPSGNEQSANQAHYPDQTRARGPLSFPRMEPNMQYPVFPIPVVSQPQQHSMYYAPHASPSQPVMYPPPTITHYAKMGSYHQIPTYPHQMPGSSHPIPWATPSGFHPAIPTPPLMNPVIRQPPLGPFGPCTVQVSAVSTGTNSVPLLNSTTMPNSNTASSPPEQVATVQAAFNSHQVSSENSAPASGNTDDASAPQPTPIGQNKKDSSVQILPQALVDGAINVAANAYSTAWNAINTLRPKEGEAEEFDPVFENNMALLDEMGFNNLERNARLLKRFKNDVSQVIGVICAAGGGSLEID